MHREESTYDILLEAYEDGCRRIEQDLWEFTEPLYEFCDRLVQPRLPDDWPKQVHAYLDAQEPKGYEVLPEHRGPLLEWIPKLEQHYHRQRAKQGPQLVVDTQDRSGPTIILDAPPGIPMPEEIAAERERAAKERARRHDKYEELLAQWQESATKTGPEQPAESSIQLVGYPLRRRKARPAKPKTPSRSTAPQVIVTKPQLPADHRGAWVKGTKGDGVFRYNYSMENRRAGLAGKEFRFKNQYIAVGGFPPEAYYRGSATKARVRIDTVTGLEKDALAADRKMRKKLRNPRWQRPRGYIWNHAGPPGSKYMELVKTKYHLGVAHKGPAAPIRAELREARARGSKPSRSPSRSRKGTGAKGKAVTGRAMGTLTVYLTARDAFQAAGVLQPSLSVVKRADYYFVAGDGSVFVVWTGGLSIRAKLEFVAGPRKGSIVRITRAEATKYRKYAESVWGKYISPGLLSPPRFIPGTKRKKLHYYDRKRGAGWIDEDGIHYYGPPGKLTT